MTQRFARLVNDVVVEVIDLPDDKVVQRCFHPDIVKQLVSVPPEIRVAQGMIYLEAAGMFDDPPPAVPPVLSPREKLAQTDGKLLQVVEELADMVLEIRAISGINTKPLSDATAGLLAERKMLRDQLVAVQPVRS